MAHGPWPLNFRCLLEFLKPCPDEIIEATDWSAEYGLIREYASSHVNNPYTMYRMFLNQAILGSARSSKSSSQETILKAQRGSQGKGARVVLGAWSGELCLLSGGMI